MRDTIWKLREIVPEMDKHTSLLTALVSFLVSVIPIGVAILVAVAIAASPSVIVISTKASTEGTATSPAAARIKT